MGQKRNKKEIPPKTFFFQKIRIVLLPAWRNFYRIYYICKLPMQPTLNHESICLTRINAKKLLSQKKKCLRNIW